MSEELATFELTRPIAIPNEELYRLTLHSVGRGLPGVESTATAIAFRTRGWYEVLLTVQWDSTNRTGHRFAHTAIPDHHPLHSEAIDANVLAAISDGRQLLRGNTMFEPGGVESIQLEVWQDSGTALTVSEASLEIRPLAR